MHAMHTYIFENDTNILGVDAFDVRIHAGLWSAWGICVNVFECAQAFGACVFSECE